MKLNIYHNPGYVLAAFYVLTISWYAIYNVSDSIVFYLLFFVYLFVDAILILMLIQRKNNETPLSGSSIEKLLIIAPHQDDCVLMAGGMAIKNIALGGEVKIVYLCQSQDYQVAEERKKECIDAWKLAGVNQQNLLQLNVLPELYEEPDKKKIEIAREKLQALVDDYQPTTVVFPLFEGGHRHHDITNYIASFLLKYPKRTILYEAPIYSFYYSMINTPHKIVKLITRFFSLNLIAYYPPTEGIDGRKIHILNMTKHELNLKNSMLLAFRSQNGMSLSCNYGYADRIIFWRPNRFRPVAFDFSNNLAVCIAKMYQLIPLKIAKMIYPTDISSHGYKYGVTNLDYELNRTSLTSDKLQVER